MFSEITVKEGKVNGYLKPLFKDVKAYDPEQDRDKGLLQKDYEKMIDVISQVLKIPVAEKSRQKTTVAGPVDDPKSSTWEMVVTLIQNAFFDAVLPGLEGRPAGKSAP